MTDLQAARSLIASYMRAEGATEGEVDAKLHSLFGRDQGDEIRGCSCGCGNPVGES